MPFEIIKEDKKVSMILKDNVSIRDAMEMLNVVKEFRDSDIEVDMKSVSSIDCSIVQILLVAKIILKANGVNLLIYDKSEEAEKTIKMSGATGLLS